MLEVDDEGPGIADGDRERVFERFYRGDGASAAADGGAGLGPGDRALDRGPARRHDPRRGREPQGCRMVVSLPQARA